MKKDFHSVDKQALGGVGRGHCIDSSILTCLFFISYLRKTFLLLLLFYPYFIFLYFVFCLVIITIIIITIIIITIIIITISIYIPYILQCVCMCIYYMYTH